MRKPKIRELGEAIKALVSGPYTENFPKEPHEPYKRFRGKPEFSQDECVGCAACAQVCPAGAIDVSELLDSPQPTRKLVLDLGNCIFCGQCEDNCITEKGIHLTKQYDLATLDRSELYESVEKDLVLCEMCSAVIGTADHIRWVADTLGPACFSNPTLMLSALQELVPVEAGAREEDAPVRKWDRIRVICPKCRRETTVGEIY